MRWSQLRKQLLERVAPSLAGRVDFHIARYRHANDQAGRAWLTLDGVEVLAFSDIEFESEFYPLAQEIRRQNAATDYTDPSQEDEYYAAYTAARTVTTDKANFARWDFTAAARRFLQVSIEDALASDDPLVRALAVFDRRVGKKRLADLAAAKGENPAVVAALRVRCGAEGIDCRAAAN